MDPQVLGGARQVAAVLLEDAGDEPPSNSRFASVNTIPFSIISENEPTSNCCFTGD